MGITADGDAGHRVQLAEMEVYNKNYPKSLTITGAINLETNESGNIGVEAELNDNSTLNVSGLLKTVTSSHETVATVTNGGVIKAIRAGSTTITATVVMNGFEYTSSEELVVTGDDIPTADVSITAPALNANVSTNATVASDAGYTASNITWSPVVNSTYAGSTEYTATVTLTPKTGYQFTESTTISVNSNAATTATLNNDGTVTIQYVFPATATPSVLSNDALLSNLTLDQGALAFVPSELHYTANVPNTVTSLQLSATKANPNQTLAVTGATSSSVTGNVHDYNVSDLQVGSNVIGIQVTAEDGITKNTYQLIVNRAPASSNADLSSISLSSGLLSPSFASNTTAYSSSVGHGVSSLTVTASVSDSLAAMTVNGISTSSGQTSEAISLSVGSNPINIVVTAQNGSSKTYVVTVTRDQATLPLGSGGDSTAPSNSLVSSTNGNLTLPIGKAGEVSLNKEVTVSIPAGASAEELKITIEKVLNTQNLLTNQEHLASPVFELLKNFPENFSKPITLTFAFDKASLQSDQRAAVFYFDEVKKEWVEVPGGKVNGEFITVNVNHFTKYAVFAVSPEAEVPTSDPSTDTKLNFSDIAGHWAEVDIKKAVSGGIITGYPDGTFKPNRTVTRAEFAVMVMNTLKLQGKGAQLNFTDSAEIGAWAQQAVALAVREDILRGYTDGSFRPQDEITRAEMAVVIARALSKSTEANAATDFADDKDIAAWAKGSVAFVKQAGIMQGKGDDQFAPQDYATRAEAVTVLLKVQFKVKA